MSRGIKQMVSTYPIPWCPRPASLVVYPTLPGTTCIWGCMLSAVLCVQIA
jgi:hypothetical protein